MQPSTCILGTPPDALFQVDVQMGVSQTLQHNVQMTFMRLNLAQTFLVLTINEHVEQSCEARRQDLNASHDRPQG